MLNDITAWTTAKMDERRIVAGKLEARGKPPSRIYLVNASIEQRNRFLGVGYGSDHIPERENARDFLAELDRRRDVLYTPDVVHMEFAAMVRNLIGLVEEGIRRMRRVARNGIRRESSAAGALSPREDGTPAWVCPNRFDMQPDTGFWRAKFMPRFDAKFENGLIVNALKSGLSLSSSTAGETTQNAPLVGGASSQCPTHGMLSDEEVKTSYTQA